MSATEYTLSIRMSDCEGTVIRALGLMERRGFVLKNCKVGEPEDGSREMDVSVTSSRPGDLLKRQLERLHDVYRVELEPSKPIMTRKPGIRPISTLKEH